jgi:hypothetical protein
MRRFSPQPEGLGPIFSISVSLVSRRHPVFTPRTSAVRGDPDLSVVPRSLTSQKLVPSVTRLYMSIQPRPASGIAPARHNVPAGTTESEDRCWNCSKGIGMGALQPRRWAAILLQRPDPGALRRRCGRYFPGNGLRHPPAGPSGLRLYRTRPHRPL